MLPFDTAHMTSWSMFTESMSFLCTFFGDIDNRIGQVSVAEDGPERRAAVMPIVLY